MKEEILHRCPLCGLERARICQTCVQKLADNIRSDEKEKLSAALEDLRDAVQKLTMLNDRLREELWRRIPDTEKFARALKNGSITKNSYPDDLVFRLST